MSRSNMGRWIGVCLTALVTMGCTQITWIGEGAAGAADERRIFVKPGFITIKDGKASVSPKKITLYNRHQIAIWVLGDGYQEGDDLAITFEDGAFQTKTDLRCGWRICAMHIPPNLGPAESRMKKYDGVIKRSDGTTITLDPQVEIIDF